MRVFSVLGPSQAGKSTLLNALAHLEAPKSGVFDVSGASNLRFFSFLEDDWAGIEIAGGMDNLSYAGPALAASDAAVLCVPPEADAAVLSAPYLRLAEEAGVPLFLFINRLDSATERLRDIVAALQAYCVHNIVLRQIPLREQGKVVGSVDLISERAWKYCEGAPSSLIELPSDMMSREQEARTELLESLADFDDALLEQLIEDRQPMANDVYDVAAQVLQHNDLVPAFFGSASHGNGIMRLMKCLRHEAPGIETARARLGAEQQVDGVACLADMVKHLGKVVAVRAFAPGLKAGATLGRGTIGSMTDIDTKSPLSSLETGQIGLMVKSDHLQVGRFYSGSETKELPEWAHPARTDFRRIVRPAHDRDETRLSNALARLTEVDPGLTLEKDEQTGVAVLVMQGSLHARHLVEKLDKDFGIEVELETVPAALRETICRRIEVHHRHRKQSGGAGQFADVVIEVRPLPRGSGFVFEEQIKGGAVPRNYIPAVEAGARDALLAGPNGFPVIDVSVVLKDGKHHAVDSSDFAFRTAGKNALREAMSDAGTVVLQPIARVFINVPSIFAGGLVSTISGLKGQVLGFEPHPTAAGWDVFNALLPTGEFDALYGALGSTTRGTGWFNSSFDHYQEIRADTAAKAKAGAT